ncbi:hypothetical protein BAUCODRAFT_250812 [Baudoinia panamericana UAMH 10762]|uniref:Apple domain-containing protein n=1 Tax=Baudoinia panamericana (strain UAMH 10762) TaxID=717646 RepID=M2MB28_BAUPA|nr:uncharacterized protein BAUCODRAFT_250812 [Baudoinia panamericana UAMH 10762]EMC93681.1 hypothetical protein BAUCODRAFT_250812 [Baudoinia panamericana UAMH 10762]
MTVVTYLLFWAAFSAAQSGLFYNVTFTNSTSAAVSFSNHLSDSSSSAISVTSTSTETSDSSTAISDTSITVSRSSTSASIVPGSQNPNASGAPSLSNEATSSTISANFAASPTSSTPSTSSPSSCPGTTTESTPNPSTGIGDYVFFGIGSLSGTGSSPGSSTEGSVSRSAVLNNTSTTAPSSLMYSLDVLNITSANAPANSTSNATSPVPAAFNFSAAGNGTNDLLTTNSSNGTSVSVTVVSINTTFANATSTSPGASATALSAPECVEGASYVDDNGAVWSMLCNTSSSAAILSVSVHTSSDFTVCFALCDSNPGCIYFEYGIVFLSYYGCVLKTTMGDRIPNPGFTAAVLSSALFPATNQTIVSNSSDMVLSPFNTSTSSLNSTSTIASLNWSLPANGSGSAYASACQTLQVAWTSLLNAVPFSYAPSIAYLTYTNWTAQTTTLGGCDSWTRLVGEFTPIGSGFTSTTIWEAVSTLPAQPSPPCSVNPSDCGLLWSNYNNYATSWGSAQSAAETVIALAPSATAVTIGDATTSFGTTRLTTPPVISFNGTDYSGLVTSYSTVYGSPGTSLRYQTYYELPQGNLFENGTLTCAASVVSWASDYSNYPYCSEPATMSGCGQCTIYGGTVQLLYFPVTTNVSRDMCATAPPSPTTCPLGHTTAPYTPAPLNRGGTCEALIPCPYATTNTTTTDSGPYIVSEGMTYYENRAYISLQTAYASNSCGRLGTAQSGRILTVASNQVYSLERSMWSCADYGYAFSFADLLPNVPYSAYNLANPGLQPYDEFDNVGCQPLNDPGFLYPNWMNLDFVNGLQLRSYQPCDTLADQAYRPTLVVPTQIRALDPAWASCAVALEGLYDPPKALQEATTADGVSNPGIQSSTAATPGSAATSGPQATAATITAAASAQADSDPVPTSSNTGEQASAQASPSIGTQPTAQPSSPAGTQAVAQGSSSPDSQASAQAASSVADNDVAGVIASLLAGSATTAGAAASPANSDSSNSAANSAGGAIASLLANSGSTSTSETGSSGAGSGGSDDSGSRLSGSSQIGSSLPAASSVASSGSNGPGSGSGTSDSGSSGSGSTGSDSGSSGSGLSGSGSLGSESSDTDSGAGFTDSGSSGSGSDSSAATPSGSTSGSGSASGDSPENPSSANGQATVVTVIGSSTTVALSQIAGSSNVVVLDGTTVSVVSDPTAINSITLSSAQSSGGTAIAGGGVSSIVQAAFAQPTVGNAASDSAVTGAVISLGSSSSLNAVITVVNGATAVVIGDSTLAEGAVATIGVQTPS